MKQYYNDYQYVLRYTYLVCRVRQILNFYYLNRKNEHKSIDVLLLLNIYTYII